MLNERQRERYALYRNKYHMGAKSAYHQASMFTEPGPSVIWEDTSNYTHPTIGTVVDGPFTYKIRLIPDNDDCDSLRGKLTDATGQRCDHDPIQYEDFRHGYFCPYCNRPNRGSGALITWRDRHSGSREFAWFEPEDIEPYNETRAYFIKANYSKAEADSEARRYLSEACERAVKVLEGDIAFLGIEVRVYAGNVSLGEASCWGFEYEGPESMEYIELDGVREEMSQALYDGLKNLPKQIESHEKYLRELYEVANAQNIDYRPLFLLGPNATKEIK